MDRNKEAWAVFWCSLLSPVLLDEISSCQREAYFRTLSQEERLLPNGQRKKLSVRTLRRRWKQLQEQGVTGLYRRRRSDRGKPRSTTTELIARAVELKREQPRRSHQVINRILRREFGRQIPKSTLYRHLKRAGATRRQLGVSRQPVRCRWTRDHSNSLWVGDFEHGPPVVINGRAVRTHLSAWIDCHSRYIVEARYYVRENLDILIDSLLRAWAAHGASRELYVDNAKIYHANALKLACTELNIKLLHRPPRDPAPGGLIERFFQTLQMQLEAEVRAAQMLTLSQLNQALRAWLSTAYHVTIHSETRETPEARYQANTRFRRQVDPRVAEQFFYRRELRTVDLTFSDVRIDNRFFVVDPKFRGESVIVVYNPFYRDSDLQEVELYSLDDVYLGVGRRYDREKGAHPPPEKSQPSEPIAPLYIDALLADQAAKLAQRRDDGIDYYSAQQRNVWSWQQFASHLCRLLGRSGGLSGLTADELESLQAFHERHDRINEERLRQAFAAAEQPTIPQILLQLQLLLHERNF